MLQNPHYSSHAEQQARDSFKPPKRCHQPGNDARTPELLEAARAITHLRINEAARSLGVSRSVLTRLRDDYGLEFAPSRENASGRLKRLAGANPTMHELAAAAELSYSHTYKLCKEYGIEPGVPYGQDAERP